MKLGILSAIMADYSFEEMIDTAAEMGYTCVEVACWPKGKALRRYAGVTHIDIDTLDEAKREHILSYCKQKGVSISALGYYPNPLDADLEKRETYVNHIVKLIKAAAFLGVDTIGTFIGRDQKKTVTENLALFQEVWPPIVAWAEENKVKIAIENCPMLFTEDEWPGGQNLATTPAILRKLYELIPSPNFGLNFDPSHFVWQKMDYLKPLHEFKDRLFHIHIKDIKVYEERLQDCGTMATPLTYMSPKLPGLGDVNWSKFVSTLKEVGYTGAACVEIEDKDYEDARESIEKAMELTYQNIYSLVS